MEKLNEPLNAQERFLYAIAVRLEAIIEQNNSIIDALSKDKDIAVEEVKITESAPKTTRKRTVKPKVEKE